MQMRVIEGRKRTAADLFAECERRHCAFAVRTQDDIVRLPDEIDGVPVTEVGAYVLSERVPDLTGKDAFAVRITCGGTEPKHQCGGYPRWLRSKDAKVLAVMHL